jgi:exodeoxyribonuclease V alpha subunit
MNKEPIQLSLFQDSDFTDGTEKAKAPKSSVNSTKANTEQVSALEASEQTGYPMRCDLSELFDRLSKSRFRSSFYLNAKDKEYIHKKGWAMVRKNAAEMIAKRLAAAYIPNDGRQTPMRHGIFPPFLAQHATGCCCRGCLEKWHHIPKGRALTQEEQQYVVDVLMEWLHRQCND